jgi:hypothetical protein
MYVVAVKSKRLTPVKNFETNLRLSIFSKKRMIKNNHQNWNYLTSTLNNIVKK